MKMQKYWFLGFLGLIGFCKVPTIWAVIADGAHWMGLSNLLWFRAEVVLRNEADVIARSPDHDVTAWRIVKTPLASFLPGTEVAPQTAEN